MCFSIGVKPCLVNMIDPINLVSREARYETGLAVEILAPSH